MKKTLIALLACIALAAPVFAADYSSWARYKNVTVNTTGITNAVVTNIPVLVRFSAASQPDMFSATPGPTIVQAGGADLRFTQADGTTDIPFEVDEWVTGASGSGAVWVLVSTVASNSASAASFRVYWGKADAQTTASSDSTTFSTSAGFQGVWHLSEASGADAKDATSNKFHGTALIGQAPTTPGSLTTPNVITVPQDTIGIIGRGKVFKVNRWNPGSGTATNAGSGGFYRMDGSAAGANTTLASALTFGFNQAYTMSAWVRPTKSWHPDTLLSGIIMGKGDNKWWMGNRNTGKNWQFTHNMRTSGADKKRGVSINGASDSVKSHVGLWTHLAVVRSDSNATQVMYLNGVATGTLNAAAGTAGALTDTSFHLGRDPVNSNGFFFSGTMDEPQVSNVARTANWIRLSFETQKSGATAVVLGSTEEQGPAASVPGAPTNVVGTPGDGQVSVAFDAPEDDGGAAITGYTVTSSPGDFTGTGAASPIVVTGLANGTPYTFTVKATNSEGPGASSSPSSAVTPTPAATVPGAPTDVAGTAGNASVSVSFTAPASDGGAAITSYTATSNPNGFSNTGAASPIVVSGLANGTAYTFTVTATNSVGEGDASAPSASVTPRTVPGAPTNVAGVAGAPGTGQVSVTWDAPGSTGGSAITAYTVTAATSPGGVPSGTCGWTTGPLTCTVGSLAGGSSYTFTAVAANIAGPGASSSPSSAVLVPEGGGSPYASWAKYRDITVNTMSGQANVAGAVTNFPLLVRLTAANAADVLSDDATGASVRFSSPDGETAYSYVIERWTGANAEVWVRVPSVPGNTNAVALRLYWGKDTTSASNGPGVFQPSNGFVAVYLLNEAAGANLVDATGNGNSATPGSTNPTSITSGVGVGKNFAGNTNSHYAVTGGASAFTSLNTDVGPYTISAWANPVSCNFGTNRYSVFSKYANQNPGGQKRFALQGSNNNTNGWRFTNDPAVLDGTTAFNEYNSDVSCTAGTWQMLTATFSNTATPVGAAADSVGIGNGTNLRSRLWRDRNHTTTGAANFYGGNNTPGPGASVFIGKDAGTTSRNMNGGIDHITVSSVVRDSNWIRLSFETQKAAVTAVTLGSTQEQGGGPTAPGAPTNVAGTAGNASVTVTWDAPASDGGSAITAYTVSAATSPGGVASGTPCGWTTGPLTCAVTGLTNGQAYTFTVTATNGVGTGAASTASSAVTPRTVPGAPTNVAGTAGDASVTVTWDAPASDGGSAITAYTVSAATSPGGVASGTPCGWTTGPLTCAVTGLTNGQAYTFTAVATNIAGSGAASAPSSAVTPTPAATVPGAPTNVAGTAGNASVTVTWDAPASDGGSAITAYTVSAATSPGGVASGTPCGWTTGPLTCAVTGLTNGQAYTFTATAANGVGTGNASAASSAVTPRTVPGAPTNVAGTAGNASVTVTWDAPASDGGSAITAYTVSAATSPGGVASGTPCGWTTGPLTCAVTGLTNGQAYTFTAVATNIAGSGAASAPSSAVTPRTVPGAPQNVAGTPGAPGTGQVAVTWNAPASDGGAAITAYTVTAATSPGGVASGTCGWTTGPLTCTVGSLTGGSSYTFTAVAANVAGAGTASAASAPVQVPVNVLPGSRVFRVTGAEKPYAFALPGGTGAETATLRITDLWGRTVWSGSVRLGAEATSLEWNGRASNGRLASAGLYVARLVVAGGDKTTEQIRKAATLKPE